MNKKSPIRWNMVYRLTLVEDETHRRIRAIRFSRIGMIIAVITVLVVFSALAYFVIGYTPIRTTIPGYPDSHFKRDAIANAIKIDSLENQMTRWELYSQNLSRVLAGEEELSIDSVLKNNTPKYLKNLSEKELARRDSLLRGEVKNAEKFAISSKPERVLPIEGMHFFTPLRGTVSQGFDMVIHPAIDITAPANSVVAAALDGTVVFAGWTDETGYTIQIQHPSNILSFYKHNQKLLKKVGNQVKAGTPIALVGNTGSLTTGDHLHFELWYNGQPVDPTKYCSL